MYQVYLIIWNLEFSCKTLKISFSSSVTGKSKQLSVYIFFKVNFCFFIFSGAGVVWDC